MMQAKRNLRLLISLVILTGLCFVFIFSGTRSNTIEVDKSLFRVEDQTQVNKVVLEASGKQIELRYDGSKWVVNNSFEADRQLVTVFFATIMQAEPKRPVSETLLDSVNHYIQKKGIHIRLFEGEAVVKDFWASGNDRKTETYFQLTGDKTPYLVTIPGYRVYVASIFELPANDWRDKRIFNFRWETFKSLISSFHKEPREDFTISFKSQYFGIDGLPEADTTKLNDYLDAVSLINGVRFVSAGESKVYDSLLLTTPDFTILVTDIANRKYQLEVFPPAVGETAILGRLNRESPVVFNRKEIALISRKRSYFVR
jgi:hypothetical protein